MSDSVDGEVGGQHERRESGLERLLDDRIAHLAVTEDVDLEPAARGGRGCGDLGRSGRRDRREAHHGLGRCRAASGPELVLLVRDLLERHRSDEHRHRHGRPEHGGLGADRRDVDEDARSEAATRERLPVPAKRPLVARSAMDVAPRIRRDDLLREPLGVVEGQKLHVHAREPNHVRAAGCARRLRTDRSRGSRLLPRTRGRTRGSRLRAPGRRRSARRRCDARRASARSRRSRPPWRRP